MQQTFLSLRTGEIIERYVREPGFRTAWDDLQRQFFCCGTNLFNVGFEDWKHIYGRENNSVPDSCCQRWISLTLASYIVFISRESEACGAGALAASAPSLVVHTHGCLAVLQAKLETELITLLTGAQVQQRNLSNPRKILNFYKSEKLLFPRSSPFSFSLSPSFAWLLVSAQVTTLTFDCYLNYDTGVPSLPGKRHERKPSFVDLYTTRVSSEV